MRPWLAVACLGLLALGGCSQAPQSGGDHTLASPDTTTTEAKPPKRVNADLTTSGGDVIANIKGRAITRDQLQKPVFEAFGLRFLIHMAKLELAIERARESSLIVTEGDVARERAMTLEAWFKAAIPEGALRGTDEEKAKFLKAEYDRLLLQYLDNARVSMPEFEIAVRTSAYVRKIAEDQIKGTITEDHLRKAFAIEYGEKVRVRHIMVNNMQEMAGVQRRLRDGESFEDVARKLSKEENSREFGGEIRPFSRAEQSWPDAFKEAAFALKPGEVSDPVKTGDALHLIKLVERIPPQNVRFEDHRESVRANLQNALLTVTMRQMHMQLTGQVTREIRIEDPLLRSQFREQLDRAAGDTHDSPEHVRKQLELDRQRTGTTRPAATTDLPGRSEVARPPATGPGL